MRAVAVLHWRLVEQAVEDFLRKLKAENVSVLCIAGWSRGEPEERFVEGADAVLRKPFDISGYVHAVRRLFRSRSA